jgi:hypothetical protein
MVAEFVSKHDMCSEHGPPFGKIFIGVQMAIATESATERKEGSIAGIICGAAMSVSGINVLLRHQGAAGFACGMALVLAGNLMSAWSGYRLCKASQAS